GAVRISRSCDPRRIRGWLGPARGYRAAALQQVRVRSGLGDREDPHLAAVLVPGPGPGQVPGQLPGGGTWTAADRGQQYGEPPLVMGRDGVDPAGQATEPPFVRGQHLVYVEFPRPGQRVQVTPERVGRRAPLDGDVRGDPG